MPDPRVANSETGTFAQQKNLDTEVGRIVVDAGLASRQEVDLVREQLKQSSDPNQRSLTDLLIENGFITSSQATRVRRQIDERRSGQIPGYTLMGKLGKGAMATVYKARQISLDRIVAVKVLPKKSSQNAEFVERFYKEGRAAAKLGHNNIVQAIDVGSTPDGYHYFVMEYVQGRTLYDVMQPPPVGEGRNFTEPEALDIGIQIAEALAHSHEKGLIHRDVKPKNIILTSSNIAKLTDLGLAREVQDKQAAESEAGKAYGTPYYISPEQIRGDIDIDFRADIYSLGATLYHMVTGKPPFDGESPSAVMHKHLREPLTPPDHLNVELSSGISEIIEVAMNKVREERYQSTEDFVEDMRLVRSGQPPKHARQAVDLDAVAKLHAHGQTVDLDSNPHNTLSIWGNTTVIVIAVVAAVSVVLNLVLLLLSNR
jgi:eukaryotic-like serine/threonine-protein kinase